MPATSPTDTQRARGRASPAEGVDAALAAWLEEGEQRLTDDERALRTSRRWTFVALGLGIALIAALVVLALAVAGLRDDVNSITKQAPQGSVATASIRGSAITQRKLAAGSVTSATLTPAAVGTSQLAPNSVTASRVRPNALTGARINEATLATVPSATQSSRATDAAELGGLSATAYVSRVKTLHARSATNLKAIKTVELTCPTGTHAIGGGAAIEGAIRKAAIVKSTPTAHGWLAVAKRTGDSNVPWRLVVTAVCAKGGSQ